MNIQRARLEIEDTQATRQGRLRESTSIEDRQVESPANTVRRLWPDHYSSQDRSVKEKSKVRKISDLEIRPFEDSEHIPPIKNLIVAARSKFSIAELLKIRHRCEGKHQTSHRRENPGAYEYSANHAI